MKLKKLENAMHQAFKPTWGGPNDPDALKMQLAEQEEFRAELQRICEDGKHVQIQHPPESGGFILSIQNRDYPDRQFAITGYRSIQRFRSDRGCNWLPRNVHPT